MCKFYKFLYKLIPIKSFQSILIKEHFSTCSRCQKGAEIDSQLKEIVVTPNRVKKEDSLWPQIKLRLHAAGKEALKPKIRREFFLPKNWQWAAAGFILVVIIGLSLFVQQNSLKRTFLEEAPVLKGNPRIWIKHAEIKGKKARPYIYQTLDISFIWFSEFKNNGG